MVYSVKRRLLLVVLHFFLQTSQAVQITEGGFFYDRVHGVHRSGTATFVATALAFLATAVIAVSDLLESLGVRYEDAAVVTIEFNDNKLHLLANGQV